MPTFKINPQFVSLYIKFMNKHLYARLTHYQHHLEESMIVTAGHRKPSLFAYALFLRQVKKYRSSPICGNAMCVVANH
jgi:hypothetical protein